MKYLSIFLALTATLFGQALKTPGVNGENIVNPAFQNAVLPTQTSNVGKYLQTNGISVTWAAVTSNITSGPVTSAAGVSTIANGAITNAMLANGAVANLLGTNTGDNSVNSLYSGLAASKADDNAVVKLAGAQTITGNKTFSGLNTFTDAVTFNDNLNVAGNISGNGSAITNIPAANLIGTVNLARLVNTQTVGDANATITASTRDVLLSAITAARTYILPLASAYPAGARVSFVDMANTLTTTNTATLARAGSDLINGATSYVLSTAGASPMLISDGVSRWNMDIRGVPRGGSGVTSITGIIKGNGTAPFTAAVAETDYLTPTGSAASLTGFPTFNQNTTGTAAGLSAVLTGALGGTGVANTGKTLTLGASLTTTGTDIPTFAFPASATAKTYTYPTTTATLARTDAAQTFTGAQTLSGQLQLTAQAATDNNSAMTRGLADTRYGTPYNLYLTATVSAVSTTFVNGTETITLPAGNYYFEISLYATTASTTGGINAEVLLSANNDTGTAGQIMKTPNLSVNGANTTPLTTIRVGSATLQYLMATHADAPNKACCSFTTGYFTLTASTTFTPRVAQRSATDAANAAQLAPGTSLRFTKL